MEIVTYSSDSLCASSSISPQHDGRTLSLDHHMYNEICDNVTNGPSRHLSRNLSSNCKPQYILKTMRPMDSK